MTTTQLQNTFRGTALDKWADKQEWGTMIEAFDQSRGKVATAKGVARAIIRRKTGLTDETVRTYVKRDSKSRIRNNP
jgi:hypothetical protein